MKIASKTFLKLMKSTIGFLKLSEYCISKSNKKYNRISYEMLIFWLKNNKLNYFHFCYFVLLSKTNCNHLKILKNQSNSDLSMLNCKNNNFKINKRKRKFENFIFPIIFTILSISNSNNICHNNNKNNCNNNKFNNNNIRPTTYLAT